MSDSFQALKRNRTKGFDKLTQSLNKLNQKSSGPGPDDRFWKPEVDKAGNGYAVVRFLSETEGEDVPFVRIWDHGFQGPTGLWYIENSLTTLNQDDLSLTLSFGIVVLKLTKNKHVNRSVG
jgi:hypothetical protein